MMSHSRRTSTSTAGTHSPLTLRHLDRERDPDATPVPSNPNPKLSTSIPARTPNLRRTTAPPSSFSKAGVEPVEGSQGSKLTTPQGTGASRRRTPSTGGVSATRNGKGVPPPVTPSGSSRQKTLPLSSAKSVASARSIALSTRSTTLSTRSTTLSKRDLERKKATPAKSPIAQISSRLSPNITSPAIQTPAIKSPVTVLQPSPEIGKKSPLTPLLTPPITNKAASPIARLSGASLASPRPNGLLPTTPNSTPSKPPRPNHPSPYPPSVNATPRRVIERPESQASSVMPGVPWTSSGVLHPGSNQIQYRGNGDAEMPYASQPMGADLYSEDRMLTQEMHGHDFYEGTGTEMTLDMVTEVDENDFDEDLQVAFDKLRHTFMIKLTHYKRLLEQAHASSASQLHALQAELRLLRHQIECERKTARELEMRSGRDREALFTERRHRSQLQTDISGAGAGFDIGALRGDGRGSFDEVEVRRVVRGLKMSDRMRLIHIILDSCLPGDISQMIRLLEKYAASTVDIIGVLPPEISARVLSFLSVHEILDVELVSKTWQAVVHHPYIWRRLCLQLTSTDPVPLKWPEDINDWEPLYKSLHHRERNFSLGLAQSLRFLRGHTNFCTTLILKGNRLISGSYDETIRVWDVAASKQTHVLQAKAISCLDYVPEESALVAGFHDVGRVQVWSTVTWQVVQTLQGHLYGIRSVAMSSKYVVSAGADKALVCWDWRAGQKIVRFGQQTNLNIGVQIIDDETVVGVTVDGIVRTFSIRRKEMISQFKLNELAAGDPVMSARLANVGVGSNNMLQWFAAKGKQMTCATKNVIIHLVWPEEAASTTEEDKKGSPTPRASLGNLGLASPTTSKSRLSSSTNSPLLSRKSLVGPRAPSLSLSTNSRPTTSPTLSISDLRKLTATMARPPKILAVIETPDVAVGAVDPLKRRVTTATRFSSRAGADRRIFVSTYTEQKKRRSDGSPIPMAEGDENEPPETPISEVNADIGGSATVQPISGAWAELAHGPPSLESPGALAKIATLPPDFKGLAQSAYNPMSMALSHEEVVVGCANGDIYVMSFVGWLYAMEAAAQEEAEHAEGSADGSPGEESDSGIDGEY
ncbi:hypothetical protein FRB96_007695 [Tulasnella sp. 330]|nr:hypothetical protein FRB96_007695 [Tulasnella sp. 330]KAG8881758.1 hypothetical protein FRB97_009167 [Tulasnella sp. 331]KAG8884033.1 hypothetical protein FRB98_002640 [Tulasnella sp. 332]